MSIIMSFLVIGRTIVNNFVVENEDVIGKVLNIDIRKNTYYNEKVKEDAIYL